MSNILIIDGSYHLGDNIGIFQASTYIGLKLSLPVNQTWINTDAESIYFVFSTTDVETWGDWNGHRVSINGTEIGRLKDSDNTSGNVEEFVISVSTVTYKNLLGDSTHFVLEVELERQPTMLGFSDDFRLTRIASREVAISIG